MKFLLGLLFLSCASGRYAYSEADSCPANMSEGDHRSGMIRCTALCSSYGRDVVKYDADCRCWCAPAMGGGYRPQQSAPRRSWGDQT